MEIKTYTITVFTENFSGMLLRVTNIFTKRKLNIESITASESEIKGIHRYTIVVITTRNIAEIVAKQIAKQVDVLRTSVQEEDEIVFQEIALYKLPTKAFESGDQIETIVRDHHARILAFNQDFVVIEKTGHKEETQELFELLRPFGLLEFVRSGRVAITKPMTRLISHLKEMEKNFNHEKNLVLQD